VQAPSKCELVRGPDHADRTPRDQGEVRPIRERRAQRDDLLDSLRNALRQHLGQKAAPAVTDQGDARAVLFLDLRQSMTEPGQHVLGMKDVELDAR
jgi:hypothetical protein